jgi:hypothetical protein
MTHENNQNPDDLNWMEIAREDAINDVRHSGQRLPFIAAAVSLLIIGGGAVYAQTSNETPAQAEEISVTQTSQTSSTVSDPAVSSPSATTPSGIPVIPNVAPGVGGYEDEDEDDDDEYEDDDDHEDDDHDEDEDDD